MIVNEYELKSIKWMIENDDSKSDKIAKILTLSVTGIGFGNLEVIWLNRTWITSVRIFNSFNQKREEPIELGNQRLEQPTGPVAEPEWRSYLRSHRGKK